MIDKWYFTNLKSRKDKADAQELVSVIQQFPEGILERFLAAVEPQNMPETVEKICDMMVADGFAGWSYDKIKKDSYLNKLPARSAINWTRLKLIRQAIEKDYHFVMVSDNGYPVVTFDRIIETINSAPSDMKILYLNWEGEPHNPAFDENCYKALSQLEPSGIDGFFKNFVGISTYIYLTPSGAKAILDAWMKTPVDFMVLQMALGGMEGCYVCDPSLVLAVGYMSKYPFWLSSDNRISLKNRLRVKDRKVFIEGSLHEQKVARLRGRIIETCPDLSPDTVQGLAEISSHMDSESCEKFVGKYLGELYG